MPKEDRKQNLRPRERDTLFWSAKGKTAWEIGKIFGISQNTVQEYIHSAIKKLDASTKTDAVIRALVQGLLNLSDFV